MNCLELTAQLIAVEPLRFTPAGVPIVNCVLSYIGKVAEAEAMRELEFEVQAIAAGACSRVLEQINLGSQAWFSGFLARKRRHSKMLVFHIVDIQVLSKI